MALPATKRKPSGGTVPQQQKIPADDSSAKFYAGPTVPKVQADVTKPTQSGAKSTVSAAKQIAKEQSSALQAKGRELKRQLPTTRNHTFLNSVIIALTLLSFFTLQFCPPPPAEPTTLGKLNPLSSSSPEIPAWQAAICRPTNAYRTHILEPYIVPRVRARVQAVRTHPIVTKHVQPLLRDAEVKIWRGYLRPIYRRSEINAKRFNARFIQPRLPILRKRAQQVRQRLDVLSRPFLAKLQSQYEKLAIHARPLAHQVEALKSRAAELVRRVEVYLSHPTVRNVQARGIKAYNAAVPHALRIKDKSGRYVERRVVPRARAVALRAVDEGEELWKRFVRLVSDLYYAHVHPLVKPHLDKADRSVFQPYVKRHITQWTPTLASLVMTPSLEDIRSAIRGGVQHVKAGVHDGADKIAEAAGSVKGAMTDNVAAATQAVRDAVSGSSDDEDVDDLFASPPTGINTEQVPLPPPDESKEDRLKREKLEKELNDKTRKEIDQALRMLEGRVDVVGRKQKEILTDEIRRTVGEYSRTTAGTTLSTSISTLQKEASRTTKAYDKYLSKLDLSVDQDKKSKDETKEKITSAAKKAHSRLDGLRDGFFTELDQGLLVRPVVEDCRQKIAAAVEAIMASIRGDHRDLANKMTYFKLITHKDWARYQDIEKTVTQRWKKQYDKILGDEISPLLELQSRVRGEVSSLVESYRVEIKTSEHNALHKLGGGVGILPTDLQGVKDAANAAIGKSKEQIMDALKMAGVVAAESEEPGVLSSASSVAAAAASSASAAIYGTSVAPGVVDKASSVASQASASVSSIAEQASASVSSIAEQASSAAHSATRSAMKAAGATPSPENLRERAEDLASLASASASSVADFVGHIMHEATRSASSAVGATPSPEALAEHASSLSARVEGAAGSLTSVVVEGASSASSYASQATESVKKVVREEL